MVPHIAPKTMRGDYAHILLVSAIVKPEELPVGIVTGLIGGASFI
jgi:ABC-type Fe3+-siderophore transport system permease subunit